MFARLSAAIQSKEDLAWVAAKCFETFEDDNVRLLEVRTTPKKLKDGSSEVDYIDTVLEVIEKWKDTQLSQELGRKPMVIRFQVSLNRAYPPDHYYKILEMCKSKDKWSRYITGLDYSGDPWTRDILDYTECYRLAREAGMKLSIHTAELPE